jgi:hypothetical protein
MSLGLGLVRVTTEVRAVGRLQAVVLSSCRPVLFPAVAAMVAVTERGRSPAPQPTVTRAVPPTCKGHTE